MMAWVVLGRLYDEYIHPQNTFDFYQLPQPQLPNPTNPFHFPRYYHILEIKNIKCRQQTY
jgi:hypothetical protein